MKKKRTGASLNRHKSKQDVETPANFINAVVRRFGALAWDLAASAENAKAPQFFTPQQDSLKQHWHLIMIEGWCWLNPQFGNIEPWVKKCAIESAKGARILLLVPASVDSNWWAYHVHPFASTVLFLRPRLQFVGHKDPFPKGLALCVYDGHQLAQTIYECWQWTRGEYKQLDIFGGLTPKVERTNMKKDKAKGKKGGKKGC